MLRTSRRLIHTDTKSTNIFFDIWSGRIFSVNTTYFGSTIAKEITIGYDLFCGSAVKTVSNNISR